MADLTSAIIGAESSGNPFARNPKSSAGGLGQFIDSTWLATVRKHRPDLATGKTNDQILQLKFDPAISREMTGAYAQDNQGFLKSRGIDPSAGNTYLAHFAGPQGAAALHANPGASAEATLGGRVVAANPFLRGKSGADVINWAAGKVGDKGGNASMPAMPVAQPVAGSTGTLPGLPDFGPMPSERRKAMAEALFGQSFRTANSATNPLGALAAIVQAGVGSHLGGKYDDEKASWKRKLAEGLAGAKDNDSLSRMLLASGDDDLVKAAVNLRVAQAKPQTTSDIQEYQFAMKQREELGQPKIPYDTWIKEVKAKQADSGYGTNLYSYKTKDGKNVPFQTSKAGGRLDLQLPEGAEFLPGVELKDIGTAYVPVDKKSGVQAGPAISKDIVGKEAAEEVGKLGGQAQVALPAAKTMVDNARKTIAELRAHPGLNVGTGASNLFDPRSWTPGTDAYDFQAKNKQAQGQSFMAARDALKGAGQVTDFEGAKGEQAIANLDAAQSKEQYLSALDTLESMMRSSYMDLQRKAAGARATAPAAGAPAPAEAPAPAPTPAAAPPLPSAPKTVPPQAVEMLKGNPTPLARQQFDEIFGPGAADRALGPQSSAPTPQELQSAYSMVQ